MYIRAHMCVCVFVCPRVVNPSTGLGGVGEAPFFVCPRVVNPHNHPVPSKTVPKPADVILDAHPTSLVFNITYLL
jgi:hypothetical protein